MTHNPVTCYIFAILTKGITTPPENQDVWEKEYIMLSQNEMFYDVYDYNELAIQFRVVFFVIAFQLIGNEL